MMDKLLEYGRAAACDKSIHRPSVAKIIKKIEKTKFFPYKLVILTLFLLHFF